MLQIAQFYFKVFRRSSFTGGIFVVLNVPDKKSLNLTEIFSCQDRDHCGEAATGDVPGRPRLDPIRRAATVERRCGKAANGGQEAVMKLLLEIGGVHPDSERTMKANTEQQLIPKRK
jgi:hypothetical protein